MSMDRIEASFPGVNGILWFLAIATIVPGHLLFVGLLDGVVMAFWASLLLHRPYQFGLVGGAAFGVPYFVEIGIGGQTVEAGLITGIISFIGFFAVFVFCLKKKITRITD